MYFDKEEKRQAVKAFSRIHGSLVLYNLIAVGIILGIQFALMYFVPDRDFLLSLFNNPYFVWGMQVVSMYVIAFPLFLLLIKGLPSAKRIESSMSLKEFGYIFLVSEAIMLGGSILSNWLTNLISEIFGLPVSNTTSDLIKNTPLWVIILVVVIIGPIVEELIFRKVMIDKLSIYGDRLAVIVSAIAFGLFHGNLYQLFYATALGLVLGYVYTKTRRSIYNCLLHIIINFMGTVPALLLQGSIDRLSAVTEDTEITEQLSRDALMVSGYSLLQYVLAVAGLIVFIVATVKHSYRFSNEKDIEIPVINRPRVLFFNLGTIVFLLYFIANCFLSLFA